MEFTVARPDELPAIAEKICEAFPDAEFFAFYGKMGAGKTTFIHAFLKKFGVVDAGASPTFSIVNTYYARSGLPVYHFDFYRIESQEEVYDIGYEEYFYGPGICLVEWPEKIPDLLPDDRVSVFIEEAGNLRKIRVERAAEG